MFGFNHISFTSSRVLTHELTHAYDHIVVTFTDTPSSSKYWKNGDYRTNVIEPRAVRAANFYRKLKNLKLRRIGGEDVWVK